MMHVIGFGWFVALSCIPTMPGRIFFFFFCAGQASVSQRTVIPTAITVIFLMLLVVVNPCAAPCRWYGLLMCVSTTVVAPSTRSVTFFAFLLTFEGVVEVPRLARGVYAASDTKVENGFGPGVYIPTPAPLCFGAGDPGAQ